MNNTAFLRRAEEVLGERMIVVGMRESEAVALKTALRIFSERMKRLIEYEGAASVFSVFSREMESVSRISVLLEKRLNRQKSDIILSEASRVRLNDELFLLAVAAANDRLYPRIRAQLSITDIENPDAKDVYTALEHCFLDGETGVDAVLSRISSEVVRTFLMEHTESREFKSNPEPLVSDGIKALKQRLDERRRAAGREFSDFLLIKKKEEAGC